MSQGQKKDSLEDEVTFPLLLASQDSSNAAKLRDYIMAGIQSRYPDDIKSNFLVSGSGKWEGKAFENWIKHTIARGLNMDPDFLFNPKSEDINDRWDMNINQVNIKESYENSEENLEEVNAFMNDPP